MKTIDVHVSTMLADRYRILIGHDMLEIMAGAIASSGIAKRYIVLADKTVANLYWEEILRVLADSNLRVDLLSFPAGERSKCLDTVARLSERLIRLGADRKSALIALGGGVTGDLTGFVASIYMRGIPFIQLPTSLMAMVDGSIGGKTGVNLPSGKNLLGTFQQPEMVLTDIQFLETLPDKEYQNGLAEVVKCGIISGEPLFGKLENSLGSIQSRKSSFLEDIIATSCEIKAQIVTQDENEKDQRRILNFGHTLGHAMETASGYSISHGNVVAVGMIAAARLSQSMAGLPRQEVLRIERLISTLGLPNRVPSEISTEDIMTALQQDKKKQGNNLYFVMLRKIGEPILLRRVEQALIRETIDGLRE